MISQMSFMTLTELQELRDTMETWSQLCLDGLSEMEKQAESELKPDTLFKKGV
jgi:hypothetical protein